VVEDFELVRLVSSVLFCNCNMFKVADRNRPLRTHCYKIVSNTVENHMSANIVMIEKTKKTEIEYSVQQGAETAKQTHCV
jgi:hypothetical protein